MNELASIFLVLVGAGVPLYFAYSWYRAVIEGEKPAPLERLTKKEKGQG